MLLASCNTECDTPDSDDSLEFLQHCSARAFPSWATSPPHRCTLVDLCRKSTLLEEMSRVTVNTSGLVGIVNGLGQNGQKALPLCRFETFDESETISRGPAAIVTIFGSAIYLRNVGSILGGMAPSNISHPHFESCPPPSHIALSPSLVKTLGLGFLKHNRNCLLCSLAPDLPLAFPHPSSPGSDEQPIAERPAASLILLDSTAVAC